MDAALQKALLDRVYDKRKAATLDLERQVRDCLAKGDRARVNLIVQQLCSFLAASPQNVNARNGGLIGLAGIAIALGVEIAPFLEQIAKPVLACFNDPDSKIRYFACESFYNIAKVCKGEILVYFNETFDALSKLAADSELSVKNGAELLDRLLKDIVCETAPHYVSQFQDITLIRAHQDAQDGFAGGVAELDVAREKAHQIDEEGTASNKVFSLARFIPLLAERMYVLSPFTRNYLVSWITVLGSVPELELVSYLPSFLGGLLKYLSDPNTDVRVATANVLADFLREIRHAAELAARRQAFEQHRAERQEHRKREAKKRSPARPVDAVTAKMDDADAPASHPQAELQPRSASPSKSLRTPKPRSEGGTSPLSLQRESQAAEVDSTALLSAASIKGNDDEEAGELDNQYDEDDEEEDIWVQGTEVRIDYAAVVEILINHIGYPDEEIQATTLQWIAEFLLVVKDVVVPFTPRLISAILPSLAHHSPAIASAAHATNINLYRVIQDIPAPATPPTTRPSLPHAAAHQGNRPSSSTSSVRDRGNASSPTQHGNLSRHASLSRPSVSAAAPSTSGPTTTSGPLSPRPRAGTVSGDPVSGIAALSLSDRVANDDRISSPSNGADSTIIDADPFDYQTTVNALTLQLLDEHEETRVTALEWLLMLHRKSPRKILSMDDGTFPALLKTLSDPSDEVIRCDLRLLAQISSASEDSYFHAFMANLLSLFSTDRRLLETRGSLIIRQLCASLHTERIFRTLAEILEKDEDLEFASIMVQNLAIILITSPELADFRKKLRNLDSREGQQLFASIYRCWCHNAVAAFSLCLLAQAYEHASNLLTIFAELEITVSLLIQIDKLVQLLESPIFTALRLQLLEPERYPYLFKCLYGILMLLPQSSAFVTLRNRLNAVNGLGFLHSVPRSSYSIRAGSKGVSGSATSSTGTGGGGGSGASGSSAGGSASMAEIKWNDLVHHFRVVQNKHERARRQAAMGTTMAAEGTQLAPDYAASRISSAAAASTTSSTIGGAGVSSRRRVSQVATPANGGAAGTAGSLTTPGSGRFGLGLSATPSNSRSSASLAPNTGTSSFFGIHLPTSSATASASTAAHAATRSSSPSTVRRHALGSQPSASNPGSRNPSKGSSLR